MSYISHEDYKNFMGKFQKETPKGMLKENVKEGNAFTAALAKTKKGGKAKVDGKEVTDTSNYDDPSVKEYGYADNYPGSWGYKEGLNPAPMQATGPTISTVEEDHMEPFKLPKRTDTSRLDYDPDASRFEPDYMKTPGEDDDDEDDVISATDDFEDLDDELPTQFKRAVAGDRRRHPFLREGQAPFGMEALPPDTKQQLQTSGLKRLSPTEREQLQEYIESVKTIKKEIAKLAAKAGKKVREEGGDTTGLMMGPQVTSEAASKSEIEDIESKISDKLYSAAERVIKHLMKANLSPKQIKKFLNHEVEEMAQKKSSEKHDKVEEAKWMRSTGYPKDRNKFGNQNMKLKVVPNPNAGKYRIVSLSKSGGVLDNRFFDTEEEANEVMKGMSLSGGAKVVKLPDTMTVYTT